MIDHRAMIPSERHAMHSFEYANAAARTGATGFTSADLYKVALQVDTKTYYILTATTPTWKVIGTVTSSNTAAGWTAANPILSVGEFGYETDTDKFKIGDGVTAWTALHHWRYIPEHLVINTTGGTTTLTTEQNKATSIQVAGALVGNAIIEVANTMAPFVGENTTTGAFTVTFKTVAGTGIAVTAGTHQMLYADGTNVEVGSTGGAGSGDVVGPAGAVADNITTFNGVTGKLVKDSGVAVANIVSKTLLTAKGSLISASAASTPIEVLVGPDGASPIADSTMSSGIRWANIQTASATPATILYPNTTILAAINAQNAYEIDEMAKVPELAAEQVNAIAVTAANSPLLDEFFLYDIAQGFATTFPAGTVEFHSYCSVSSVGGGRVSNLHHSMYLVEVGTGTLATTGAGTTRTATITAGTPFVAGDYNASRILTSFIRTPTGIHMITGYTSTSVVSIDALAGYTNETGVAYTIYRYAFGGTSPEIVTIGTDYQPVTTSVVVPTALTMASTTKLALAIFGISNNTTTVNFIHNGTTHYSHIHTTLVGQHNDLPGLNVGDYVHFTAAQFAAAVTNKTGTGNAVYDTAPQISTIELGHATDTTISRSSAGVVAVEGVVIPSISSTNTLTNKRITARTSTEASSATPTINTDNVDRHTITALAVDITSMTTNLTGTPVDGDSLIIEITGTAARAITWGASFESSTVTLPATTVTTAKLTVGFLWNTATSKWRCVASV